MTQSSSEHVLDSWSTYGSAELPGRRSPGTVALLFRYGVLACAMVATSLITKVPAPIWFVLALACLIFFSRCLKKDPAAALALLIVISSAGTYRGIPAITIGVPISLVDIMLVYMGLRLALGARSARRHDRGPFVALLIVMVYGTLLGLIIGNDKAMVFRHLHDALPFALIPLNIRLGGRDDDLFRVEAALIVAGVAAACLEIFLYVRMIGDFAEFRNAGIFQFIIALAAGFLLHWQLNRKSVRTLPGHAAAIVCQGVLAAGMFVSGTRNAMVLHAALLVTVIATSAIVRGRAQLVLAGMLVIGLGGAMILMTIMGGPSSDLGPAMQRFSSFSNPMRQDDTFALRIRTTEEAVSETLSRSPVLGLGFGSSLSAYGSLSFGISNNVEVAPGWWFWTTGLVGLVIWLYYSIVTPLRMISRAWRLRDPKSRLNALVWTITCAAFIGVTSLTALVVAPQGSILASAFLTVDWRRFRRSNLRETNAEVQDGLVEG